MTESGKAQADRPKSDSDVFTCPFIPVVLLCYGFRKVLNKFSFGVLELLLKGTAIGERTISIAIVQVADERQQLLFLFLGNRVKIRTGTLQIHPLNQFQTIQSRPLAPSDSSALTMGMRILIHQIQMQQQGQLRAQASQDEHIDEIHELAQRMKIAGLTLNEQLKRQEKVMDALHSEMEATEGRLGDLQKQVGELLQTRDVNQVCTCLMLCCFMIVLIILIIVF